MRCRYWTQTYLAATLGVRLAVELAALLSGQEKGDQGKSVENGEALILRQWLHLQGLHGVRLVVDVDARKFTLSDLGINELASRNGRHGSPHQSSLTIAVSPI